MSSYTWVYLQIYEYLYILINIILCSYNYICIYPWVYLQLCECLIFNIINAENKNKIKITF